MKKSILEVYALAVCFFAVACFAIGLGISLYAVVEIAAPAFTVSAFEYNQHQSNDAFRRRVEQPCCNTKDENKSPPMSEEELTRKREESWAVALRGEQREGSQSLIRWLIVMLVDCIVFFFHWRIARHARETSS